MITHSPQAGGVYEGFGNYYNHLPCWVETDPVSLCFRALKAGEARRSRFQLRGYTIVRAEEKKPHCWPKLTSFFLNNSTCVLALGAGGVREGTSLHTVRRELETRPRAPLPFSPPHGCQTPLGSYLRQPPA